MEKEGMSYSEAVKELESIVEEIEGNNLDIDKLGEKLKQAQRLITLCKDKLFKTDEEIKKIIEENG